MPNHDKCGHPWAVHTSRLLMSKNSIKNVLKSLFLMFGREKTQNRAKLIVPPCLHSPPYLFWRKIDTQSHLAKFLNRGHHGNSVPELTASSRCRKFKQTKNSKITSDLRPPKQDHLSADEAKTRIYQKEKVNSQAKHKFKSKSNQKIKNRNKQIWTES